MVEYKCNRCCKLYKNKFDYNRHLNRQKPCAIQTPNDTTEHQYNTSIKDNTVQNYNSINTDQTPIIEKEHICKYCKSSFTRNWSLLRHIDMRCAKKKDIDEEKEEKFNILLQELKEIKKEMIVLKNNATNNNIIKNNNNNNNINNTQNIQNNNNINIKLVAYGKEDITNLSKDEWRKIIFKNYKSIEELTNVLHFDKNKPENHNIYIPNIKSKFIMIFDGEDWMGILN